MHAGLPADVNISPWVCSLTFDSVQFCQRDSSSSWVKEETHALQVSLSRYFVFWIANISRCLLVAFRIMISEICFIWQWKNSESCKVLAGSWAATLPISKQKWLRLNKRPGAILHRASLLSEPGLNTEQQVHKFNCCTLSKFSLMKKISRAGQNMVVNPVSNIC